MDTLRYDILDYKGGWLLTDGRGPPRAFLTSTQALDVAGADARARAGPTEINLWQNGELVRVYPELATAVE
jgi:hypothetical protein